jgi:hypothetical protein
VYCLRENDQETQGQGIARDEKNSRGFTEKGEGIVTQIMQTLFINLFNSMNN